MGILIILIPLSIYLIAALSVKKDEIKHPDDYFAAFRKVGKTEFTSSSIAYGFQVSTIYPFLFWGASMFLFVPFVNGLFWGVGILLFYFSFNKISRFLGSGKTLPGLIGDTYGNNARLIASFLTIVGFIGYIVAELWFGSRVLLAIFPNNNWIYLSTFIFVFFIAIYLFKSGQVSSIRTDQLQLAFTYFGIFGIILYLLYMLYAKGGFVTGALSWGVILIAIIIPVILILRKSRFITFNSITDKILNILITVFFIAMFLLSVVILFKNKHDFVLDNFFNLEGFGYAGIISLILLPLGWQFVDLTNWQRLLSVKASGQKKEINRDIKKGLLNFSVESPFTWILFIVFGLLITVALPDWTFEDILIDFPKHLIGSSSILQQILGYIFIVSIISIMLSTVDSFFMGISFTYTYDINPKSRKLLKEEKEINISNTEQILKSGKYFGFMSVLIAVGLFVFFDKNIKGGGDLFINLLLTFYSASLAFFPSIFGLIFLKRKANSFWSVLSMTLGAFSGILIGFYSVLYNPAYAWYPVPTSLIVSIFIYLLGSRIKSQNNEIYMG